MSVFFLFAIDADVVAGIVVVSDIAVVSVVIEDCVIRSWVFVFETCYNLGRHEPGIGVNRLVVDPPQQSWFLCN